MRIGLDLRMANENFGIGRYSLELAKQILEKDRVNQYVVFVRDLQPFLKLGWGEYPNLHLVLANFRHYSFAEQTKFLFVLLRQKLDFVHFMNFNVPIFYRRKYILTLHDVIHFKLPGNKPTHFFHRLAGKYVIYHAAKMATNIITVSQFSKKEIVETLHINPDKITVIYEAAKPVPVSDSDVVSARQIYGISKPYIVFVGVMERKKNILALVKAFDILKESYQANLQLVLVGKADAHYPEIIQQAKQIKYAKDLIITGSVPEKEKYALIKGAISFVSASLFEGFGLPGVEAMIMGIPLVVSNTEVFNEVYDNGAIYFDAKDPEDIAQKIYLMTTDAKYRALIANNAYARAGYFSWAKTAEQTLALYKNV